jgi:hypothetical protein
MAGNSGQRTRKEENGLMQITKIEVTGQGPTPAGSGTTRMVGFYPLPEDGTFSIRGEIRAVNPASTRGIADHVVFNINCSGIVSAGVINETDGVGPGPSGWPTQPSVNPFTGTGVTAVFTNGNPGATPPVPPLAELEFTAPSRSGVAAEWFWDLDFTIGSVP